MEKIKNKELYNSLSALTKKSLEIIKSAKTLSLGVVRENAWVKRDSDLYQRCSYIKPLWYIFFERLKSEILHTDEYKTFETIAKKDEAVSRHIDKLSGTCMNRCRFELDSISYRLVSPFLSDLIETNSDPVPVSAYSESMFKEKYLEIEHSFYSDTITFERLTPICGFYSDNHKIIIDENTSIIKLSESEIIEFLNHGITIGHTFDNECMTCITGFAIRVTYHLPKIFGDIDTLRIPSEIEAAAGKEQKVIGWLKLFQEGAIYPITTLTRGVENIFAHGASWVFEKKTRFPSQNTFNLTQDDVSKFIEFCKEFENKGISNIPYMNLAIRRFGQANERESVEDRIIDLFISAEALFLSSDMKVEGELVYRLSHRASMLIGKDPERQSKIFDFMKKSYNARSAIVHGSISTLKPPLKADKKTRMSVEEYCLNICEELEDILRYSIVHLVAEKDKLFRINDKQVVISWDLVIFRRNEYSSVIP